MYNSLKAWLILGLLLGTAIYAIAEEITLTTYYPSPRGVYQELKTAGDMVVGDITNPPGARLHVVQDDPASAVPVFRADDETSDTSPLLVDASGNVGIGTAGPAEKLVVSGDARVTNKVYVQEICLGPSGSETCHTTWPTGPYCGDGNCYLQECSFCTADCGTSPICP